ncbi:MAG: hypothetical protein FD156_2254 [Nitrospirae bacterium]|nr:MAG: hypothetical protein FD156_2254 [Nitrospirota bacterium]
MEILFEVKTAAGKIIRTTKTHWELISKLKHPEMEGKETEVKSCLSNPLEIRKSSEDTEVYLYYSPYMQYYICVVAKHLNGDGFIITAYITDKIKEGETVWKR